MNINVLYLPAELILPIAVIMVGVILIYNRSVDKICGKTAPSTKDE